MVAGIAVARYGENALAVIEGLKSKISEISHGLPEGVSLEAVYDRSELIERAIKTLRNTLLEESIIVALVCLIFLFHARSALVAIVMLPVGVLVAAIAMRVLGMNSNIMSLGGIAIAIGAMVDAAIVMIENAHKHIERDDGSRSRAQLIIDACQEVGQGFAGAAVWNVQNVDAGLALEHLAEDVAGRTDPGGAPAELAGIGFGVGHQFRDRIDRQRRMYGQDHHAVGVHGHRHEIFEDVERDLAQVRHDGDAE